MRLVAGRLTRPPERVMVPGRSHGRREGAQSTEGVFEQCCQGQRAGAASIDGPSG